MQWSCSLRCRCFVTPGAVSSCKANCRTEDLHRLERATVRHSKTSNNGFHEARDRSQCSIIFRSVYCPSLLYFACVCMLFATFTSWAPPILVYFIIFAASTNNLCPVSEHGCQFRTECCSYETRSFGGPYFPVSLSSTFQACISHAGLTFYCH